MPHARHSIDLPCLLLSSTLSLSFQAVCVLIHEVLPESTDLKIDVLVIPQRRVARLNDLDDGELACLMSSIRRVGGVIEKAYGADALTVACQVNTFSMFTWHVLIYETGRKSSWSE